MEPTIRPLKQAFRPTSALFGHTNREVPLDETSAKSWVENDLRVFFQNLVQSELTPLRSFVYADLVLRRIIDGQYYSGVVCRAGLEDSCKEVTRGLINNHRTVGGQPSFTMGCPIEGSPENWLSSSIEKAEAQAGEPSLPSEITSFYYDFTTELQLSGKTMDAWLNDPRQTSSLPEAWEFYARLVGRLLPVTHVAGIPMTIPVGDRGGGTRSEYVGGLFVGVCDKDDSAAMRAIGQIGRCTLVFSLRTFALQLAQKHADAEVRAKFARRERAEREQLEKQVRDASLRIGSILRGVSAAASMNMGANMRRWGSLLPGFFANGSQDIDSFGCTPYAVGAHNNGRGWRDLMAAGLLLFAQAPPSDTAMPLHRYWKEWSLAAQDDNLYTNVLFRLGLVGEIPVDDVGLPDSDHLRNAGGRADDCQGGGCQFFDLMNNGWKAAIRFRSEQGVLDLASVEMAIGARLREGQGKQEILIRIASGESRDRILQGLHWLVHCLVTEPRPKEQRLDLRPPVWLDWSWNRDQDFAVCVSRFVRGCDSPLISEDGVRQVFQTVMNRTIELSASHKATSFGVVMSLGLDPSASFRDRLTLNGTGQCLTSKTADGQKVATACWESGGLWLRYFTL